jgi:hypothetical protein
MPALKS